MPNRTEAEITFDRERDTQPDMTDPYEADRTFLRWLRSSTTLPADLRAKWHELAASSDPRTLWQQVAISRELTRRGEPVLPTPHFLP